MSARSKNGVTTLLLSTVTPAKLQDHLVLGHTCYAEEVHTIEFEGCLACVARQFAEGGWVENNSEISSIDPGSFCNARRKRKSDRNLPSSMLLTLHTWSCAETSTGLKPFSMLASKGVLFVCYFIQLWI